MDDCHLFHTRRSVVRGLWAIFLVASFGVQRMACAEEPARRCMRAWQMLECVAVPLDTVERDAQAKQFPTPAPGRTNVYIVRSGVAEPKTKSDISVDGKAVGYIAPMTYLLLEIAPGEHVIKAGAGSEVAVRLEATQGNTYFIEHDLPHFVFFMPVAEKLTMLEESAGRKAVVRSKRAQTVSIGMPLSSDGRSGLLMSSAAGKVVAGTSDAQ
jgi:hypothetical protein